MKEIEYKNIKFYIGQNAQENWDLFDKSKKINPDFLWFHLNSFPSPYIIMYSTLEEIKSLYKNSHSEITDILLFGATLCKENSKYKFLNNLKICYYSLKKLKKGTTIGEILISGKKNLIKL